MGNLNTMKGKGCGKMLRDNSIPTRPFYKCGKGYICPKCQDSQEEAL